MPVMFAGATTAAARHKKLHRDPSRPLNQVLVKKRPDFQQLLKSFQGSDTRDIDSAKLKEIIVKYGDGILVDDKGVQIEETDSDSKSKSASASPSQSFKHCPSLPSDEEVSWIISSAAQFKDEGIVEVLKYSMV